MGERKRMYVLPLGAHKAIGVDVGAICWGSCGRGQVGGLILDNDEAIPCLVPPAECPHLAKDMAEPMFDITDGSGEEYDLVLRRLSATREGRQMPGEGRP